MKRITALLLALTMAFALCGCHQHSWVEAGCTEPKTCSECGKTEGEALGHDWQDATCTEPKTCSRCGATEGKALGHKPEGEATCTEPAVCSVCGETVRNALGHDWQEATCTEPRTCTRCGETEGKALGHDWQDATTAKPKTCTRCGETEGEPLILFYWNEPVELPAGYTACFYDDGDGFYRFEIKNPDWNSATIYALLENNAFADYGIGLKMYKWMDHVMKDRRDFSQKGSIANFILGGNTFYFDTNEDKNGFVGLKVQGKSNMTVLYNGTIGTR